MTAALHVEAAGPAPSPGTPTWVLLHGWGLNLRVFDGLAEALAVDRPVVRVDLPGHGRSAFDPAATSFEAQAGALHDALLASLPGPALLLGWSLGGQFALELARRAPERIHSLVLIASTPRFVAGPDWPAGMKPQFLDTFAARLASDRDAVLEEFLALQVRGSRDATEVLRRLHAALQSQGAPDPRALPHGLGLLRDNDLRTAAAGVTVPALVVSGQHDRVTPPAASAWLAATMPRARHVDLPRAGHAPFLSHAAETARLLREFAA